MIENTNMSRIAGNGDHADIRKFIGVASVNVLAINPDNDKLRKYGWNIPEGAPEPDYVTVREENGRQVTSTRVRFLVQIQDLDERPVIPMDFWCRPEMLVTAEKVGDDGKVKPAKCKIIDNYGRTAWGTREEITAHQVPQYASGPANISTPYRACHPGEGELVGFLLKYLNVTPLQIFDRSKQEWVASKNPGRLTIDNWTDICNGNVKELAEYCALEPDNRVKVILGVRTTDDNRTYQTFLDTAYLSNSAFPDRNTGEYASARRAIDKFFRNRTGSPYSFSASPVKEWSVTATQVQDNSAAMFDEDGNFNGKAMTVASEDDNDLPF